MSSDLIIDSTVSTNSIECVEGRIEDSDRAIMEGALAPHRVCVLEGIVEYDVVSCH